MSALVFSIPIRTHNPLNGTHGHWATKAQKRSEERETTALHFKSRLGRDKKPSPPVHVELTRFGPRRMDDEGAIASLKSIRDQLADELGVDDGDEDSITFSYKQEKGSYAVRVEIKTKGAP